MSRHILGRMSTPHHDIRDVFGGIADLPGVRDARGVGALVDGQLIWFDDGDVRAVVGGLRR